ncbi:hypothetical protein Clacol_000899 [Clathrus columnatus]|uniref:Hexosyltransferase n=1 Tax=Clathrus columnatus TaxID=1419009 RepID=A0AAV4ZXD0_9AGAM|nr:hypothetical protein Clacol_000899 [Clathrus columnatus]
MGYTHRIKLDNALKRGCGEDRSIKRSTSSWTWVTWLAASLLRGVSIDIKLVAGLPFAYTKLPTGDSEGGNGSWPIKKLVHRFKIPIIIATLFVATGVIVVYRRGEGTVDIPIVTPPPSESPPPAEKTELDPTIFAFDKESRPLWMDSPPTQPPLSLRVAVLSHPKEVQRRQLIRDNLFKGVRRNEIHIDYRFLVGLPVDGDNVVEKKVEQLKEEEKEKGDLVIVEIKEAFNRLSEKRFAALKWADSFSNTSYDYFMNLDSDTFVRFGPLARRLPTVLKGKNVNPREDPIIIARMRPHWWHWVTTVSDQNQDSTDQDLRLDGPWYSYPIGIGYMLSSSLVKSMVTTRVPLPHHIHFPNDDVMIGSWISSLKTFPDPEHSFRVSRQHDWNLDTTISPQPLHPNIIDTLVVNDIDGWHDYPGRANVEEIGGSVEWNSVCIHHIKEDEIKLFRKVPEFQGDWKE